MGCTQSSPQAVADPAAVPPTYKPEPLALGQQSDAAATDTRSVELDAPNEKHSPQSPNGRERVRSMRLDRPVSVRKLSAAILPVIEVAPTPTKPLGPREQVQQLYAAVRMKQAAYLSVGESKSEASSKLSQPVTQAIAACGMVLKRIEDHDALCDLVDFSLPNAVVATMQSFQHAPAVQAGCFEIVDRMIEGSVHNKDRLRLAGLCPTLVSSLLQLLDDKETLQSGLETMLLLMTENMQNVIAMGNAGAHSLIVTAMATYPDEMEIQALGCTCIQYLARNGATSLALGKVGACARVVHAFKFVDNLSVVLHQTVAALCMQPSNTVEFGDAGLCEVLVRLMDEKPHATLLQGLLLPTIQQLGRHEANRKRLYDANICESLMTVHLQHPTIVFIQEHFCETVFVLAQDDNISTTLGNSAACESILQMMRRLAHYRQIHYLCCLALFSLSHTTANYQRLGQTGALQQIQRALDQFDASAAAAITGTPTPSKKKQGSRKLGPGAGRSDGDSRVQQSVKMILNKHVMDRLRVNRANSTSSSVDFYSESVQSHEVVQQPMTESEHEAGHHPLSDESEHHDGSDSGDEEPLD